MAVPPQSIGFRLPGRFRVCARQIDTAKLKMGVTCSVFFISISGPNQNGKAILTT